MASASLERRRTLTLAACIIGSSLAFIDATVVIVALPTIEEDLDLGLAGQQWVFLSYSLALASLYLVAGAVGDRVGRRTAFVSGVAGFAAASLLAGIAPNGAVLIVARALQGVAGAFLTTNSLALLRGVYGDQAGRAIGLWTAFTSVATIIGPPAGGAIVEWTSWRWIFLPQPPARGRDGRARARGPLRREARRAHRAARHPRRGPRRARLRLPHVRRWSRAAERGFVGTGGRSSSAESHSIAFAVVERRVAEPMLPFALFRRGNLAAANAETFLAYAAIYGFLVYFTLYLQTLGFSPFEAGLIIDADDARDDPAGGALRRARGHARAATLPHGRARADRARDPAHVPDYEPGRLLAAGNRRARRLLLRARGHGRARSRRPRSSRRRPSSPGSPRA